MINSFEYTPKNNKTVSWYIEYEITEASDKIKSIIYVDDDGGADYTSIQDAIDASS